MAVRYRFKSEANFSQILFNGMNISVADIKNAIYQQRKLGKSENVDLKISNAENGENFINESTLIPKNTSLIIVRVPGSNLKPKKFNKYLDSIKNEIPDPKSLTIDLTSMQATEEEKIFAMMMQSTFDYNNTKIYSTNHSNPPPSTYICHRCHTPGHWIQKCSLSPRKTLRFDPTSRMTGIPMSMRNQKVDEKNLTNEKKNFNKENLKNYSCENCKENFRNPKLTPCCKTKYCYDCIERELLQSDELECPKCGEKYLMLSQLEEVDDL